LTKSYLKAQLKQSHFKLGLRNAIMQIFLHLRLSDYRVLIENSLITLLSDSACTYIWGCQSWTKNYLTSIFLLLWILCAGRKLPA